MRLSFYAVLLLFSIVISYGYSYSQQLTATRIDDNINIDGVLDESQWQSAGQISDFYQFQPNHGEPASLNTVVKMLYTESVLYFGFYCYDSLSRQRYK